MANLKDSIECIEKIKQDIRDLRESHFHFCPFEMNEQIGKTREDKIKYFKNWLDKYSECTCGDFDLVNDKLDELSKDLNKIRDDLLHPAMQNINI